MKAASVIRQVLLGSAVCVGVFGLCAYDSGAGEPLDLMSSRGAATRAKDAYLTALSNLEASLRKYGNNDEADVVRELISQIQEKQLHPPPGPRSEEGPTIGQSPRWQPLGKLAEKAVQVGWGKFEKDVRVKVDGVEYGHALFAHAQSIITYDIKGKGYNRLRGRGGLKDGSTRSRAEFQVFGDGKLLWSRQVPDQKTFARMTDEFNVDISRVTELRLRVDPLGETRNDWSYWINPEIAK